MLLNIFTTGHAHLFVSVAFRGHEYNIVSRPPLPPHWEGSGAAERPKVDESCGRGVEPQATVLYGRAIFCVSRLKNVQFLENSRAARARNPDPHLKNQNLTFVSKET